MVTQPAPATGDWTAFAGIVVAHRQPELAFRVAGRIVSRSVEVGDRIREGQVLAELDNVDFALRVDAAKAQLESARSEEVLASSERDRYRSLLDERLISQSDFDSRQTRLEAAQARVREAQAQLSVAMNQLAYTQLLAPADGVVVERRAEAGQVVAAGQSVFVLAVDGAREIAISVPERDIAHFAIGDAVQVELWARQGRRVSGTISELSPEADVQGRTYAARIAFDTQAIGGAELGQSARVYVAADATGALTLPLPSVARFGDSPFVWVLAPDGVTLQRRPVTIASFEQDRAIVADGLRPDDWIVVAGVSLLQDGQRVQPVDSENRPISLLDPR
jgi:multidrug efflux system membrane fusion protein